MELAMKYVVKKREGEKLTYNEKVMPVNFRILEKMLDFTF
jgi:hypothetical protein